MNSKIIASFLIFILILVIPSVDAQEINIGGKAKQKSIEVTISEDGSIHVKHVVDSSKSPKQLEFIDGVVQNLTVTDEDSNDLPVTIVGEDFGVMILPSKSDTIVEYNLEEVMVLKENYWTMKYRYLESTTFFIPEDINLIFINERPVNLDGQHAFNCHGCEMLLEYSFDENKNIKNVTWEEKIFEVEINTFAGIENFNFNQPAKEISFDVVGDMQFITIIIPLELLWEPYLVFLDDKKIIFHEFMNNGTHVWLNIRPEVSGEVSIIGTTVVPEFPIIAPLAIGFLMIMMMPFIRKFNLR